MPESSGAAVAEDDRALAPGDLQYPTLELPDGTVGDDGGVDGARTRHEEMAA